MIGAEINRPNDELEAINEVAIKIYGGGVEATLIEHLVAKAIYKQISYLDGFVKQFGGMLVDHGVVSLNIGLSFKLVVGVSASTTFDLKEVLKKAPRRGAIRNIHDSIGVNDIEKINVDASITGIYCRNIFHSLGGS